MVTYIALGSNINPVQHLAAALQLLQSICSVKKISNLYHTEPLGDKDQPWYINQVVQLETTLSPADLLETLKHIEQTLGRQPRGHWGSREIDLDILLYENQTIATVALQIPHPGLSQRRCVLVPLADIAPTVVDPHTGKTIQQLLADCSDPLHIQPYEPNQT